MIRLLFLGDIVGEPGRAAAKVVVSEMLKAGEVDFVVVNGENAAQGKGISPKIAIDLLRTGVAVITTGDHAWDQREIVPYFPTEPRLLRPINYPAGVPGNGSIVLDTAKGKIAVMNVQCRTFMSQPLDNPFHAALEEAERLQAKLARLGVSTSVQRVSIDTDVFHRVRVGPIADLGELNRIRGKLRAADIDAVLIRVGD
jgi:calcineurin-like phosphoesterase